LVKNDTQTPSGAFNGVYSVTQLQTSLLPVILTRALDYDTPSDINNTGAIPVINGTVNGTTLWVETAQVNTIGTNPLVFTEFGAPPGPSSGLYDFVVGPTQTYTTISAAITAATAGQSIFIQTGTYTENVVINKQLNITGSGRGVVINGSLEFATGSNDSLVQMVKVASGITIDAGVSEIQLVSFWNASGQTITDNGTGDYIQGMQE
jgi:pectin methylesterase-like acyl-CoA thioesterase